MQLSLYAMTKKNSYHSSRKGPNLNACTRETPCRRGAGLLMFGFLWGLQIVAQSLSHAAIGRCRQKAVATKITEWNPTLKHPTISAMHWPSYFSPRKGCPRVLKFLHTVTTPKNLSFEVWKKFLLVSMEGQAEWHASGNYWRHVPNISEIIQLQFYLSRFQFSYI